MSKYQTRNINKPTGSTQSPYFEQGSIKTSDYDIPIEEMLKMNTLPIPQFKADGQLYATIQFKPDAPEKIGKIVTFDSFYTRKMTDNDPDFDKWNEFGVMVCCFHQLTSTFNSLSRYECQIIEEELQIAIELPKAYSDVIHFLGDRPSPYGAVRHRYPVQTVIDFLCHGITKVLGPIPTKKDDWKGPLKEFISMYPGETDLIKKFRNLCLPTRDQHYILTDSHHSLMFSKARAKEIFDEFAESTSVLQKTADGKQFKVKLWDSSRWEALINIAQNEKERTKNMKSYEAWINKLSISNELKLRLIGLMHFIVYGYTNDPACANAVPEFAAQDSLRLHDLAKIMKLMFRMYQSKVPPILKKIYSTEQFKPIGKGSSMQLVVVDETSNEGRFHSKVNIKGYPIALALMFPLTSNVVIVKNLYTSHTELDESTAIIFPVADSLVGRGKK